MPGIFELKKSASGQFHFVLKADNGEVILSSEEYKTRASADKGIDSVRKNGGVDARFVRKTAKDGSPFFVLTATNGKTIGQSETYSGAAAMETGIASVKANAASAALKDITGETGPAAAAAAAPKVKGKPKARAAATAAPVKAAETPAAKASPKPKAKAKAAARPEAKAAPAPAPKAKATKAAPAPPPAAPPKAAASKAKAPAKAKAKAKAKPAPKPGS